MMKDYTIQDFSDALGSDRPTPGGGAAAAVTASLGAAAVNMALIFSNKKKQDEEMATLIEKIDKRRLEFLELIDADATGFEPLSKAYGMKRDTDEAKAERAKAIQEGLIIATKAPLAMIEAIEEVVELTEKADGKVNKNIISDVGVGVLHLRTSLYASALNIYINAGSLTDADKQKEYLDLATDKVDSLTKRIDSIYHKIQDQLYPNK